MRKPNTYTENAARDYFPCLQLCCGTAEEAEEACRSLGLPEEAIQTTCDGTMVPIQWSSFRDHVSRRVPWYDETGWQQAFLMFLSHHPILHSMNEILERYHIDRQSCSFRKPSDAEKASLPFCAEILHYASGVVLNIQTGSNVVEISLEKTSGNDYRPKQLDGSFAAFFPFESDLRTLWASRGFHASREAVRDLMNLMRESDWQPLSGTVSWQEGDLIRFSTP